MKKLIFILFIGFAAFASNAQDFETSVFKSKKEVNNNVILAVDKITSQSIDSNNFSSYQTYSQEVDRGALEDAAISLEHFANQNSTANAFYAIGFGLTALSPLTGTNTEPINTSVLALGSLCTLTAWLITRDANKHIRRAGYHLQSADSGIGVKLVF